MEIDPSENHQKKLRKHIISRSQSLKAENEKDLRELFFLMQCGNLVDMISCKWTQNLEKRFKVFCNSINHIFDDTRIPNESLVQSTIWNGSVSDSSARFNEQNSHKSEPQGQSISQTQFDVAEKIQAQKRAGRWVFDDDGNLNMLPKLVEPSPPLSQWDFLLMEMEWMAADFKGERRCKTNNAKKICKAILKYHLDKKEESRKSESNYVAHAKRHCALLSREIRNFWNMIQKVYRHKMDKIAEFENKKHLEWQLNSLVNKTKEFSAVIAENLCMSSGTSRGTCSSEENLGDNSSYCVSQSSADDEETIQKEEEEENTSNESSFDELTELANDANLDLESVINDLPLEYIQTLSCSKRPISPHDKTNCEMPRKIQRITSAGTSEVPESFHSAALCEDSKNSTSSTSVKKDSDECKEEFSEEVEKMESVTLSANSIHPSGFTLSSTPVKYPQPFLLRGGQLREYQLIGFNWLVGLAENNLNGILADEMGLGKTIQTISLIAHLAGTKSDWGPHLVVVPTSVLLNWECEFKKWCPGLKILTYFGSSKMRQIKRTGWSKPNAFHVCLTTYNLVVQDHLMFKWRQWHVLILDEAQNIKNYKSLRCRRLLRLKANHRVLLTGTPLQNNLMELWSLLHFVMPNLFQSHFDFRNWFSKPIDELLMKSDESVNPAVVQRLHVVLRPFILRRMKAEVELQMPKKYEHFVSCHLSKRQRFLYEEFMSLDTTKASLQSGNFISVLNILMQLRKVCNHPDLFESRSVISPLALFPVTFTCSNIAYFGSRQNYNINPKIESLNGDNPSFLLTWNQSEDLSEKNLIPPQNSSLFSIKQFTTTTTTCGYQDSNEYNLSKCCNYACEHNLVPHFCNKFEDQYLNKSSPYYNQKIAHACILRKRYLIHRILTRNHKYCNVKNMYSSTMIRFFTILSNYKWYSDIPNGFSGLLNKWPKKNFHDILKNFVFYIPRVSTNNGVQIEYGSVSRYKISEDLRNQAVLAEYFNWKRTKITWSVHIRRSLNFPDTRLIQYDCGKLQTLDGLLKKLKAESHRCLIFTQMSKMLDILEKFLCYHRYTYLRLDGSTKPVDRQIMMERFNEDPSLFCFILSTRTGGVGMNLIGADTVIFYDNDWNPSVDAQAQDRCHRIGQTKDVHIYRLVSEGTIEEKIVQRATQKLLLGQITLESGCFNEIPQKSSILKELFHVEHDSMDLSQEKNVSCSDSLPSPIDVDDSKSKSKLRTLEAFLSVVEDPADSVKNEENSTQSLEDLTDHVVIRSSSSLIPEDDICDGDSSNDTTSVGDSERVSDEEEQLLKYELEEITNEMTPVERKCLRFHEFMIEDMYDRDFEKICDDEKKQEQNFRIAWEVEHRALMVKEEMEAEYQQALLSSSDCVGDDTDDYENVFFEQIKSDRPHRYDAIKEEPHQEYSFTSSLYESDDSKLVEDDDKMIQIEIPIWMPPSDQDLIEPYNEPYLDFIYDMNENDAFCITSVDKMFTTGPEMDFYPRFLDMDMIEDEFSHACHLLSLFSDKRTSVKKSEHISAPSVNVLSDFPLDENKYTDEKIKSNPATPCPATHLSRHPKKNGIVCRHQFVNNSRDVMEAISDVFPSNSEILNAKRFDVSIDSFSVSCAHRHGSSHVQTALESNHSNTLNSSTSSLKRNGVVAKNEEIQYKNESVNVVQNVFNSSCNFIKNIKRGRFDLNIFNVEDIKLENLDSHQSVFGSDCPSECSSISKIKSETAIASTASQANPNLSAVSSTSADSVDSTSHTEKKMLFIPLKVCKMILERNLREQQLAAQSGLSTHSMTQLNSVIFSSSASQINPSVLPNEKRTVPNSSSAVICRPPHSVRISVSSAPSTPRAAAYNQPGSQSVSTGIIPGLANTSSTGSGITRSSFYPKRIVVAKSQTGSTVGAHSHIPLQSPVPATKLQFSSLGTHGSGGNIVNRSTSQQNASGNATTVPLQIQQRNPMLIPNSGAVSSNLTSMLSGILTIPNSSGNSSLTTINQTSNAANTLGSNVNRQKNFRLTPLTVSNLGSSNSVNNSFAQSASNTLGHLNSQQRDTNLGANYVNLRPRDPNSVIQQQHLYRLAAYTHNINEINTVKGGVQGRQKVMLLKSTSSSFPVNTSVGGHNGGNNNLNSLDSVSNTSTIEQNTSGSSSEVRPHSTTNVPNLRDGRAAIFTPNLACIVSGASNLNSNHIIQSSTIHNSNNDLNISNVSNLREINQAQKIITNASFASATPHQVNFLKTNPQMFKLTATNSLATSSPAGNSFSSLISPSLTQLNTGSHSVGSFTPQQIYASPRQIDSANTLFSPTSAGNLTNVHRRSNTPPGSVSNFNPNNSRVQRLYVLPQRSIANINQLSSILRPPQSPIASNGNRMMNPLIGSSNSNVIHVPDGMVPVICESSSMFHSLSAPPYANLGVTNNIFKQSQHQNRLTNPNTLGHLNLGSAGGTGNTESLTSSMSHSPFTVPGSNTNQQQQINDQNALIESLCAANGVVLNTLLSNVSVPSQSPSILDSDQARMIMNTPVTPTGTNPLAKSPNNLTPNLMNAPQYPNIGILDSAGKPVSQPSNVATPSSTNPCMGQQKQQ